MDSFKAMIDLQLLLLSLIAIGFVMARRSVVPATASTVLSGMLMNLFLPSTILLSFQMEGGIGHLGSLAGVLFYASVVQAGYFLVSRIMFNRLPRERATSLKYGIICNNAATMGVSIVKSVFGSLGGMYASVAVLPMRVFVWSAGVMIFSGEKFRPKAIAKLFVHPCVVTVIVGLVMMLMQWKYPPLAETVVATLARCTLPTSMLTIGLILGTVEFRGVLEKNLLLYTAMRLVVLPAAVGIAGHLASVPPFSLAVLILMAAMPAGSTSAILAAQYQSDAVYASKSVLVSTIASGFTLPFWMGILPLIME